MLCYWGCFGEVSEWLKEHAWKACVRVTVPRVRIPPSPPERQRSFSTPLRTLGNDHAHAWPVRGWIPQAPVSCPTRPEIGLCLEWLSLPIVSGHGSQPGQSQAYEVPSITSSESVSGLSVIASTILLRRSNDREERDADPVEKSRGSILQWAAADRFGRDLFM